ncbi:Hypothetical predicted protein [Pelobates cultripes]|uniref:Endonuclease/exonuclease/phosphatase domain-containing protein n=1 Tax=Pelobates cultripes TaxID=61616 RepID=A0AAD1RF33_PELCU|nr:Hypothetical predicted protein [Pelobates cultripes]
MHPNNREYTHHSRVRKTSSRIDLILVSAHILTAITECKIGDITWSDHAPTSLTLQDKFQFRGTSPWKLNDTILYNRSFKDSLEKEINLYFTTNCTPQAQPQNTWVAHKAVIRGLLISRVVYLKKTAQHDYTSLLKLLRDQTQAQLISPTQEGQTKIYQTTKAINDLLFRKTSHTLSKLRMTQYSQGNTAGTPWQTFMPNCTI